MNGFEVSEEREGITYKAFAKISGGMLTVSSVVLGSKSASESASNEVLAKLLLGELITDHLLDRK